MPKSLSLKKSGPPKNQKAITQFFKKSNVITTETVTIDLIQEESHNKRGKRKAISPLRTDKISCNVVNNVCSILNKEDSENNVKKLKKYSPKKINIEHRTPTKEINLNLRRSPRKNKYSFCEEKELFNNKKSPENVDKNKIKNERSPLCSVNNIINCFDSNDEECSLSQKNLSPKLENLKKTCVKGQYERDEHILDIGDSSGKSPKKDCTPNKSNRSALIPRRSPRIASLKSPHKKTPQTSPNKSRVALDFDNEDVDYMFSEDFNVEDVNECGTADLNLSVMQRCDVISIQLNAANTEVRLRDKNNRSATCIIEGIWRDTPLFVGETVSVIAARSADGCYVVNNINGLLVLRPDHLVSSTSVVAGVFCRRKAVLQDRFRGIDCGNSAMTIGILVHELVQKALTQRIVNPVELRKEAENLLKESIQMLYDAGVSIEEGYSSMCDYIQPLVEFMQMYVENKPSSMNSQKGRWNGHIEEILDIEENVCCPELGIKGKIDATLQVTIHERRAKRKAIMPLELKSGRASGSVEHRGQLVLYGMMLALQRGENPAHAHDQSGLLLYLRDKVDLREVSCGYPERRDLIMLRNQQVQYLTAAPHQKDPDELVDIEEAAHVFRQQLPEPVHHETACSKCPYLTLCSLYLWNTEGPKVSEIHPLTKLREDAIGHLSPSHIQYFLHWVALLRLEERAQKISAPLHALWTETSEERACRGTCAHNLTLNSVEGQNGRFLHMFQHQYAVNTKRGPKEGEFAIVSIENRPWLAAGTITALTNGQVHILLERDLSRRHTKDTRFHIDSYESYASTVQNMTNLGALMEDRERPNNLRKLILDRDMPEFDLKLKRETGRLGIKLMRSLNVEQQRAVLKALTAKHYMLLQGLPGTGKTQTISVLIQMLIAMKQRVLVTAHTHSAVDTVLTRLPSSVRILRLGPASRVTSALSDRCEHTVAASCTTPEQLAQLYDSMEVVGVTCLGAAHALLARTTFDVCIVDEATQVLQSTVLRPLLSARRFVLVGDPDQLPPVVRSRAARKLGMEESLFARLKDTGATETLRLQYRMNSALTELANSVAYNGRLLCANQCVKNATVQFKMEDIKEPFDNNPEWLLRICSTDMSNSVIFLDTGPITNSGQDKSCANIQEALIVVATLDALVARGVSPTDIGVMAPYRDQVSLLRTAISRSRSYDSVTPDVNTVDQYQGRDKSVIVYSCTRSGDSADRKVKEGEVLNDQRRLAVAVTRAKHKFIVVGDANTLRKYQPFERLLNACTQVVLLSDDHNRLTKDYSYVIE